MSWKASQVASAADRHLQIQVPGSTRPACSAPNRIWGTMYQLYKPTLLVKQVPLPPCATASEASRAHPGACMLAQSGWCGSWVQVTIEWQCAA